MKRTHPPLDYSEITPLIYVGTNACCSTHFNEMLIAKGIRADISLETDRIDAPFGAEFYLWLPTEDHAAPGMDKLDLGAATLRLFEKKGIPCYVHCKNGHGRAPTLVAAYLISEKKMSADQAVALLKDKRPSVHFEEGQVSALTDLARTSPR
jgi:protein-tyrosine phosphatase